METLFIFDRFKGRGVSLAIVRILLLINVFDLFSHCRFALLPLPCPAHIKTCSKQCNFFYFLIVFSLFLLCFRLIYNRFRLVWGLGRVLPPACSDDMQACFCTCSNALGIIRQQDTTPDCSPEIDHVSLFQDVRCVCVLIPVAVYPVRISRDYVVTFFFKLKDCTT